VNRIVTIGPAANVYAVGRVACHLLAQLFAEAEAEGGFDAETAARTLLLSQVNQGASVSDQGDRLMSELLRHIDRLQREQVKGGAA